MPIGRIGAAGSRLGNIVLGFTGSAPIGTATQGVNIGDIGPLYDFALGYDKGMGTVSMVGYVVAEGQQWSESTNLRDVGQLIQLSSPNITDRDLTFWPQVSQGDWSGGERQLIYETPNRYFQSDGGIDASKPGRLQLMPGIDITKTITNSHSGTHVIAPLATDGTAVYWAAYDGTHNLVIFSGGTYNRYTVGAGTEIWDIINTPLGIFVGMAGGIWHVTPAGVTAQWTSDPIFAAPSQSLAYFDNRLWYITKTVSDRDRISYVSTSMGGAPGNAVFTNGASPEQFEATFDAIGSSATGLVISTRTVNSNVSILYGSDGTVLTRLADIEGSINRIYEMNGVTYLLCFLFQPLVDHVDYVLYSLIGTSLSVVDDLRYGLPDFQVVTGLAEQYQSGALALRGHLFGDGRFVYIGWPGLPGLRYDTVAGGIQSVTPVTSPNSQSHRLIILNGTGLVVSAAQINGANTDSSLSFFPLIPSALGSTGSLVSSYFDFATPSRTKFFRFFEIKLVYPLPNQATVAAWYQIDGETGFSKLPLRHTDNITFLAQFPLLTKGKKIRFKLALSEGAMGGPTVDSYSIKATLGRVWKTVTTCKRNQLLRNGQEDSQGLKAKDLVANLQLAYASASKIVLYVPNPSSDTGVEQVDAQIEEYEWVSTKGSPDTGDQGPLDLEGNVTVSLVEA